MRSSSRSGRHRHRPRVEALGRQDLGEELARRHHRDGHGDDHRYIDRSSRSTDVTHVYAHRPWPPATRAIRPFNARSLVLSVLLGLRAPGAAGALAGRRRRAVRHRAGHDAHRAVPDGRRRRAGGRRRRLPARRAACWSARRPRTSAAARRPARGTGRGGSPSSAPPDATISDAPRVPHRTWPTPGWVSCGPDTWMRPANLDGPAGDESLVVVRGPLTVPTRSSWRGACGRCRHGRRRDRDRPTARARPGPALADGRPDALPDAITLAAEVVRFLRAEPAPARRAAAVAVAARRPPPALPGLRPARRADPGQRRPRPGGARGSPQRADVRSSAAEALGPVSERHERGAMSRPK